MKRSFIALLVCCSLLSFSGCSGENSSDASVSIPTLQVDERSALKSAEVSDIPNIDGFSIALHEIAIELGMDNIQTLTYISLSESDGSCVCNFSFPYNDTEAYSCFVYTDESWTPVWIIDSRTAKVYWLADGMDECLPPYADK